jgi:hypothetical protein
MLNVVMTLTVIRLNVIVLSVVVPIEHFNIDHKLVGSNPAADRDKMAGRAFYNKDFFSNTGFKIE